MTFISKTTRELTVRFSFLIFDYLRLFSLITGNFFKNKHQKRQQQQNSKWHVSRVCMRTRVYKLLLYCIIVIIVGNCKLLKNKAVTKSKV